ncbi:hypothetical protein N9L68_02920 [bacterium]|nr:hypothetical protein [bacterium]
MPSLVAPTQIGARLSVPKLLRGACLLRNAMATLAEQALLAAAQHVAESGATWPSVEVRQAWNRIAMANRRLDCRISSDRIRQWYARMVHGRERVVDDSAGYSGEPWYDSEEYWQDIESSSDSSRSAWYDRETGLQRWQCYDMCSAPALLKKCVST